MVKACLILTVITPLFSKGKKNLTPFYLLVKPKYLSNQVFGLVASPCSTPVLATLLAWVATTQDLLLGAGLLLAYALGYVAPLVLAGTFTASIKKLLELRRWSGWINPVSGTLLVLFGVFSLLNRLV